MRRDVMDYTQIKIEPFMEIKSEPIDTDITTVTPCVETSYKDQSTQTGLEIDSLLKVSRATLNLNIKYVRQLQLLEEENNKLKNYIIGWKEGMDCYNVFRAKQHNQVETTEQITIKAGEIKPTESNGVKEDLFTTCWKPDYAIQTTENIDRTKIKTDLSSPSYPSYPYLPPLVCEARKVEGRKVEGQHMINMSAKVQSCMVNPTSTNIESTRINAPLPDNGAVSSPLFNPFLSPVNGTPYHAMLSQFRRPSELHRFPASPFVCNNYVPRLQQPFTTPDGNFMPYRWPVLTTEYQPSIVSSLRYHPYHN